jgi:hypothetical protein
MLSPNDYSLRKPFYERPFSEVGHSPNDQFQSGALLKANFRRRPFSERIRIKNWLPNPDTRHWYNDHLEAGIFMWIKVPHSETGRLGKGRNELVINYDLQKEFYLHCQSSVSASSVSVFFEEL